MAELTPEQRNTVAWARGFRDRIDDLPRGEGHKGKGWDAAAGLIGRLNTQDIRDEALARRLVVVEDRAAALERQLSDLEVIVEELPDRSGGYGRPTG